MEFYNVKLLPKGLPEIIATFVPYDIYPETKIIACPRKERRGVLGSAGYGDVAEGYYIILYPTMIAFHWQRSIGTYSFRLWMDFLQVALHEIAHLATRHLYEDLPHDTETDFESYLYVEDLANSWRDQALARILQVDPRLGQPSGALTGYPGIKAYELRNRGKPWNNQGNNYYRIAEWRGLGCDGQIPMSDIALALCPELFPPRVLDEDESPPVPLMRARAKLYRAIHQGAKALGICRFYTNKNGRRYLMFNVAEAEAVYKRLLPYKWMYMLGAKDKPNRWEFVDGFWEPHDVESVEKVPEQLRLDIQVRLERKERG